MTDEYNVLDGLYYTKEHEWAKKLDGNLVAVGVDDYAQKQLHEIVYVELPSVGAEVAMREAIGAVESVKAVSDMYSPVGGKVVEVNDGLLDSPELINDDPYGEGWIAKIEASSLDADLGKLLDAKAYRAFLKSL